MLEEGGLGGPADGQQGAGVWPVKLCVCQGSTGPRDLGFSDLGFSVGAKEKARGKRTLICRSLRGAGEEL